MRNNALVVMLETLPGIEGVARIASVQCGNLPSENITPEHWAMDRSSVFA